MSLAKVLWCAVLLLASIASFIFAYQSFERKQGRLTPVFYTVVACLLAFGAVLAAASTD